MHESKFAYNLGPPLFPMHWWLLAHPLPPTCIKEGDNDGGRWNKSGAELAMQDFLPIIGARWPLTLQINSISLCLPTTGNFQLPQTFLAVRWDRWIVGDCESWKMSFQVSKSELRCKSYECCGYFLSLNTVMYKSSHLQVVMIGDDGWRWHTNRSISSKCEDQRVVWIKLL